jgi:hypothetical protein
MNYLLARIWIEKVAAEQRQSWFREHPFLTSAMIGVPLATAAYYLGKIKALKSTKTISDMFAENILNKFLEEQKNIKQLYKKLWKTRQAYATIGSQISDVLLERVPEDVRKRILYELKFI